MSDTPPFKEAWAHDFAPPIHSLDRHGDFAPPLLALGLAAGFFGVATDDNGGGLQYHSAEVYGPHNIGDWLDIKTTDNGSPSGYGVEFTNIGGGFYVNTDSLLNFAAGSWLVNLNTGGWILDVDTGGIQWSVDELGTGFWNVDIGSGGMIWTTTGNWSLSLGDLTWAGDLFQHRLNTSGIFKVQDHSANDLLTVDEDGTVTLLTPAGQPTFQVDPGGDIAMKLGSGASFDLYDSNFNPLLDISEDSTTTHNLGNGKTFTINDHNGSPLVTYTG